MKNRIRINASQPQHIPAGKLLGKMYYSGFLSKTLGREEYSGYPHNGGEHTLHLVMAPDDIDAFLKLTQEVYVNHEGTPAFVAYVQDKMAQKLPAAQAL